MIEIHKRKEPAKLLAYRKKIGASYEAMDADVRYELQETLLKEQGHLCAYCMKRIPEKKSRQKGTPTVTIEHWYPRNPDEKKNIGQGLDYKNMFAVCSGNRGCGNKKHMTCDAHKGNAPLKVNPTDPVTMSTISYTSTGIIKSDDPDVDNDLNITLNLNSNSCSLPENRKKVLEAVIMEISNKNPTGNISSICQHYLEHFENEEDPKSPFVGIIIWWLKKHIDYKGN